MGIKIQQNTKACQEERLKIKSLGQRMKRLAVEGTGLSPWEAEVLVDAINEVYFSDPDLKVLSHGQMKYACISAKEGAGKPLASCQLVSVSLQMLDEEDRQGLPSAGKQGSIVRRHRKITRLTEEAREQGGLLSQEDLATLLDTDVRTIRRDVHALRKDGIVVATRGQQKDIGPGVSHRGVAIRLWLDGKEPVEVACAINHSIGAVENYLEKFKRVAYLRGKSFDDFQIALTVGISLASVKTFVDIYKAYHRRSFFATRMKEIELVGHQSYLAVDEKKDSILLSDSKNREMQP